MRAFVMLAFGAVLAATPIRAGEADDVAKAFCATRISSDSDKVKPLLTGSLLALINDAEERSAIIASGNPDEKPPLGDGVPYQSFPDVPDHCQPTAPLIKGGSIELPVTYEFNAYPDATWTDTLVLAEDGGKLRINDIRYPGSADGSALLGLRDVLTGMFDQ
jgi:hypothetical protein